MKKLITLAVLMLMAAAASAQIQVGAGYLNSTTTDKTGNGSSDTPMSGIYVGAGYTVRIGSFGITPGVYYSNIGATGTSDILGYIQGTGDIKEQYVNIPLDFSLSASAGPLAISIYAGPMVSYGLSSETKITISSIAGSIQTEFDNFKDGDYSNLNISADAGVALTIARFIRANVGYNYGFRNRYTGESGDWSKRTSQWYAGVALVF